MRPRSTEIGPLAHPVPYIGPLLASTAFGPYRRGVLGACPLSVSAILAPVFAQVLLTVVLMLLMGRRRLGAIRAGTARPAEIALGERAWPTPALQAANAYHNQFELPVLFYALVPLALVTRKADLVFVGMAWVFVALRYAHAAVHVTANTLTVRFNLFVAGALVLAAMWAVFALRILASPIIPSPIIPSPIIPSPGP